MSINLLLNDYCDFLMTTVYSFLHITIAIKLIFLIKSSPIEANILQYFL